MTGLPKSGLSLEEETLVIRHSLRDMRVVKLFYGKSGLEIGTVWTGLILTLGSCFGAYALWIDFSKLLAVLVGILAFCFASGTIYGLTVRYWYLDLLSRDGDRWLYKLKDDQQSVQAFFGSLMNTPSADEPRPRYMIEP